MAINGFFKNLFSGLNGAAPNPELDAAVERVGRAVEPNLKFAGGYPQRYRKAAAHALAYARELARGYPSPSAARSTPRTRSFAPSSPRRTSSSRRCAIDAGLLQPQAHPRLERVNLCIDDMGIKCEAGQGREIVCFDLIGRDRRRWCVALLHCQSPDIVPMGERLEQASRWLNI